MKCITNSTLSPLLWPRIAEIPGWELLKLNDATLPVEELGGRAGFLVAVRYFNPCTSSSLINLNRKPA